MMDEEKRFKILKRIEYENEIKLEDRTIIINTIGTGLGAILAVWFIAQSVMGNNVISDGLLSRKMFTGLLELGLSLNSFIFLIKSIIRKTDLKIKVDDIDKELEVLEDRISDISEERRGMSKW